jgi:hypothetical protein
VRAAAKMAGLCVAVAASTDDADERALAWHAYFWDPWFALWGAAFAVSMWRGRPSAAA